MPVYSFGEYLPDVPPLDNKGLLVAKNVLPGTTGYLPLPQAGVFSDNALNARPQGAYTARDITDSSIVYTFIGTDTKLYQITNTTFVDVSRLGGYTTSADDTWEFSLFGNDVIATNFTDVMQTMTLGTAPFADLGGTPPQARHVGVIGSFLVVGNTFDAIDGYRPQRIRWAGIGTTTSWAVSATTQADFQDLNNDGGYVQKVISGEFGLIFQERTITRMSYIGSPLIFQFDIVERERGALAPNSVIAVGGNVFFLAQDGFYMFNGQQSIPIGSKKINTTFFADIDTQFLTRMSVCSYPSQNIIVWSYVSINATAGIPDKLLFYNYSPDSQTRWSTASIEQYMILTPIAGAYTLEGLDVISTDLDALPFSLDSRVWQGSVNVLGCINSSFQLMLFNSGTPYNATIQTGEGWLEQPDRAQVSMARPHIDMYTTVTVQIGTRELESQSITLGSAVSLNSAGFAPIRASARFIRAQFNISGSFNVAQGFTIQNITSAGLR